MIDFEEYLGQQIDLRMEVYEEIKDEVYQQGRADAIDEFVKAFKDNMLKSTTPTWTSYVEEIAEQLKENKNE